MSDDPADLGSSAFLRVLRGLLRPLVRTLIARGVTAPALYRLLKQVYVEVAEDEFGLKGKPPTDSRVSLLTGVHRRDVRSFRNADEDAWQQERQKTTLLATVLGRWLADAAYSTPLGPRPLAKAGGENSFEDLVQTIGKDVRPRTVLDELLRQNLVKEAEDGLLHLQTGTMVGPQENDQQIVFFAANVGDHLAAAAENLQSSEPPFLERAVFYNGLSQSSIDALEAQARTLSQPVLVALNKDAHAFQTNDSQQPGGTKRFRFGVYFYSEDSAPADDNSGDIE